MMSTTGLAALEKEHELCCCIICLWNEEITPLLREGQQRWSLQKYTGPQKVRPFEKQCLWGSVCASFPH